MAATQTDLDQLRQDFNQGGTSPVLDRLAGQLRTQKKYHELFEALKMKVRHESGLPLLYSDVGDELEEPQRTKLEEGLLQACREVGLLLLKDGNIREGWIYLRPVGDRSIVAEQLGNIEVDEDNLEELVEVALHEGVDAARGFGLVLEHYGTCNAITTYESMLARQSRADQQITAGLLVEHVHRELLATVRADIAQQQGAEPAEANLRELVADRDWLFGEHSYHLDTTHLASTVRFARVLEDEAQLRLALDLTEYGRRLSKQFQYQGEEPFGDIYPSHAMYFEAVLGEKVEEAIRFFREKFETVDINEHGTQAVETYVQLLDRIGRFGDAIDALIEFVGSDDGRASQVMPLLLDLSEKAGDYDRLVEFCSKRQDLLGFASGLLRAGSK